MTRGDGDIRAIAEVLGGMVVRVGTGTGAGYDARVGVGVGVGAVSRIEDGAGNMAMGAPAGELDGDDARQRLGGVPCTGDRRELRFDLDAGGDNVRRGVAVGLT